MRYIDNRQLRLPEGWRQRAQSARADVESRTCAVNDRSSVWAELKDGLAHLSHDKCWYCEAKQERSDDAVDHFRPKNRVAGCPTHSGYTWLAFDETNYRFSCTFCNSRRRSVDGTTQGKGDLFPLMDESRRWYSASDQCYEDPCTIDPCSAGEPSWLDWREDGVPVPKYPAREPQNSKASKAIYLYNLNHEGACEARRSIAIDIKSWVREANNHYQRFGTGDKEAESLWNNRCRDILKATNQQAVYSTFARRITKMLRSEAPWLEDLC